VNALLFKSVGLNLLFVFIQGEGQGKLSALAVAGLDGKIATEVLGDTPTDVKTEAVATGVVLLLVRVFALEVGFEEVWKLFKWDSDSSIGNGDYNI